MEGSLTSSYPGSRLRARANELRRVSEADVNTYLMQNLHITHEGPAGVNEHITY